MGACVHVSIMEFSKKVNYLVCDCVLGVKKVL